MTEKTYEQVIAEIAEITAQEKFDSVNKPSHYQGKYGMEAIDVVRNFAGDLTAIEGFYWGNAMKYMLRFQRKNGLEDLKKARKNLDWLIEEMEKQDETNEEYQTTSIISDDSRFTRRLP